MSNGTRTSILSLTLSHTHSWLPLSPLNQNPIIFYPKSNGESGYHLRVYENRSGKMGVCVALFSNYIYLIKKRFYYFFSSFIYLKCYHYKITNNKNELYNFIRVDHLINKLKSLFRL
jgi:hypothetical protein